MRMFKNSLLVVCLIIGLLAYMVGCSKNVSKTSDQGAASTKEPYKIGAVIDITGGASSMGVSERDALKMLVDKMNSDGGINGHQIDLKVYDDESNEAKAVLAVKKAIEDDKVLAVIGGSQSSTALAMVDTIEKSGVPFIGMGSTTKIIDGKKWAFKTPPSDWVNAKKLLSYAKQNGWKNIAFMTSNNAFGDSIKSAIDTTIKDMDVKIVAEAKFNADAKDLTVELTKLKQANPDVFIITGMVPSLAIAAKNMDQLGLKGKIPFLGNSTLANQQFIDLAGKSAEGVMFTGQRFMVVDQLADSDPIKPIVKGYVEQYTKLYGAANQAGGNSYDAMLLLAKALEQGGTDKAKIRDALENTKNLLGTYGYYNMSPTDHNGLDDRALVMMKVENGKFKFVQN